MHVVFLSQYAYPRSKGGVEYHMHYLARALIPQAVKVTIVSPFSAARNFVEERDVDGVRVIEVGLKGLATKFVDSVKALEGSGAGMLAAWARKLVTNAFTHEIDDVVSALRPDIVHQHDYLANILVSKRLARRHRIVWTNHLGEYLYLQRSLVGGSIQKRLISHFTSIIAPSKELVPPDSDAYYIPNGVDLGAFAPISAAEKRQKRRDAGIHDRLMFLVPRRWAPTKGVLYLAKALATLDGSIRRRCLFVFAGASADRYQKYSEEILRTLNLLDTDATRVFGDIPHNELVELYGMADVAVIPSLMEATSLAALEAMACGIPVLATNVGGLPEIVTDNETGWLVEPRSATALAQKIREIVQSPAEISSYGIRARAAVQAKYGWEKIAEETRAVYSQARTVS